MTTLHPLFRRFPIKEERTLSNGSRITLPYHIYNGEMLMIGGTIDYDNARELLKNETVEPMRTASGRSPFAIWVCNFIESNAGAHQELQFSLFTSKKAEPLTDHPYALIARMALDGGLRMVCHGLWNSTPLVVQYNREVFGLNACLSSGVIHRVDSHWVFSMEDADQNPLISGRLAEQKGLTPSSLIEMLSIVGWRNALTIARQPWLEMRVVNPIGIWNANKTAITGAVGGQRNYRMFDPASDTLTIHAPGYADMGLIPNFIYEMRGVKFVYNEPE